MNAQTPASSQLEQRKSNQFENFFSAARSAVKNQGADDSGSFYDVKTSSVASGSAISRAQRKIQAREKIDQTASLDAGHPEYTPRNGSSSLQNTPRGLGRVAQEEIALALNKTIEERGRDAQRWRTIERAETLNPKSSRTKSTSKSRTVD